MKLGTTELILILVVALVVFGPSKLPELGKLAGQAVGSFKKYVNSFEGEWKEDAGPAVRFHYLQAVPAVFLCRPPKPQARFWNCRQIGRAHV